MMSSVVRKRVAVSSVSTGSSSIKRRKIQIESYAFSKYVLEQIIVDLLAVLLSLSQQS